MYEIWHNETNNVVDWFDTASQAEDVLLAALQTRGENILNGTYLVRADGDGATHYLAEGRDILKVIRILRLLDEMRSMSPAEGEMPGESDIARLVESLPRLDGFGLGISAEWMRGFVAHGLLTDTPSTRTDSGSVIDSTESIRRMRRLADHARS